jgi:hypothetical protein
VPEEPQPAVAGSGWNPVIGAGVLA